MHSTFTHTDTYTRATRSREKPALTVWWTSGGVARTHTWSQWRAGSHHSTHGFSPETGTSGGPQSTVGTRGGHTPPRGSGEQWGWQRRGDADLGHQLEVEDWTWGVKSGDWPVSGNNVQSCKNVNYPHINPSEAHSCGLVGWAWALCLTTQVHRNSNN